MLRATYATIFLFNQISVCTLSGELLDTRKIDAIAGSERSYKIDRFRLRRVDRLN